jgi:hypothetical protein
VHSFHHLDWKLSRNGFAGRDYHIIWDHEKKTVFVCFLSNMLLPLQKSVISKFSQQFTWVMAIQKTLLKLLFKPILFESTFLWLFDATTFKHCKSRSENGKHQT